MKNIFFVVFLLTGVIQMSNHLSPPWIERFDPETGEDYYLNTETEERINKSKSTSQGSLWASWTFEVEAAFGKDSIFGPELVALCVGAVLTLGAVGMFVLIYSALNSKTSASTAADIVDRTGAIFSEF